MIRSTTDEMLAARFDPEPYVDATGRRYAHPSEFAVGTLDPRPEFIPSRDPEPWVDPDFYGSPYRIARVFSGTTPGVWRWSPRPEYARPEPNPILVDFRANETRQATGTAKLARLWLSVLSDGRDWERHTGNRATSPTQIEHARKVLTRLVNVYKED
jgi:hypothetical protein